MRGPEETKVLLALFVTKYKLDYFFSLLNICAECNLRLRYSCIISQYRTEEFSTNLRIKKVELKFCICNRMRPSSIKDKFSRVF